MKKSFVGKAIMHMWIPFYMLASILWIANPNWEEAIPKIVVIVMAFLAFAGIGLLLKRTGYMAWYYTRRPI